MKKPRAPKELAANHYGYDGDLTEEEFEACLVYEMTRISNNLGRLIECLELQGDGR